MALEDMVDRVKETATELWGRVQELPIYNNIHEKYETLQPNTQRSVKFGAIAAAVILLLMFPYAYFSSSMSLGDDYVNNRDIIRKLLRAKRLATDSVNLPRTVDVASLKSQLQDTLGQFSLLPEQNAGVIDLDPKSLGSGVSAGNLRVSGVGVSLKKLNLKQMVEIGYELQGKNPNVKLSGIEMNSATPDPHYYDVLYKLAVYNMPANKGGDSSDEGDGGNSGGNAGGGNTKNTKRGNNSKRPTQNKNTDDNSGGDTAAPTNPPPGAGSTDDGQ